MDTSVWQAIFFAFYLMCALIIIFTVVGDLMRDHELSGWWKAAWIIFLIVAPILAGLIYFIARGKGMAQRAQAQAAEIQKAQAEYIQGVAGATDPASQIAQAQKLKESGVISDEEFQQLKSKALASS